MSRPVAEILYTLLKKGVISRVENAGLWTEIGQASILDELEDFKKTIGFDLHRTPDRVYLIPTQDNDLFLKTNSDYRKDISANNEVRNRDLYLMNYLAIYMLYVFFNGEGKEPKSRDAITKEDLIALFSEHCRAAEQIGTDSNIKTIEYSQAFSQLARTWLSKTDGDVDSQQFSTKYGILNRILRKFDKDSLFQVGADKMIRPTDRLVDLMPYFLRKDRVSEIQKWIEVADHASN